MGRKAAYSFVLIMLILGLGGCRGKRMTVKKKKPEVQSNELVEKVAGQEIDFENIEIKYSTRAKLEGKSYSLNITYRNQKDETLWISVRAMLGIEVARVIANRDSVWVVSKIAQVKEKGTWKKMSGTIGYPLDFVALQNIMSRKLFYPGSNDKQMLLSFIKREDSNTVLLVPDYENNSHRKDNDLFGFLPQFIIDKSSQKLNGTRLVPEDKEWMFEVKYQENSDENMGLGKNMLIKAMDSESNLDLDLKIQGVSINQSLKFPFQWF